MTEKVTVSEANSAAGSKRAFPQGAGARCHVSDTRREGDSTGRWLTGLLVFLLVGASLIALYQVAQMPRASSSVSHSSSSIRTVRSFYAGLNEYMETGNAVEITTLLAPGAWSVVPEHGIMGDDSGLLTYLTAMRSTFPKLRFTTDRIDAGDDLAIAEVRMSGTTGALSSTWPSASGTSQEFFRVRDGRIVQHWTTAPGSVLLHPLTTPPVHFEHMQPGYLAIAEFTFPPGQSDPPPIDGPALVLVQRGRLTLTGNGSAQILDLATGATSVPGLKESASAVPGQAIVIPSHATFVRNGGSNVADALVAMVHENYKEGLAGTSGVLYSPSEAIHDAPTRNSERMNGFSSVTVRPLEVDDRSIPNGSWELENIWAVLGPGASLPLAADDEWALVHVISSSGSSVPQGQHGAGTLSLLNNDGDKPMVALVIRLRAAP